MTLYYGGEQRHNQHVRLCLLSLNKGILARGQLDNLADACYNEDN